VFLNYYTHNICARARMCVLSNNYVVVDELKNKFEKTS